MQKRSKMQTYSLSWSLMSAFKLFFTLLPTDSSASELVRHSCLLLLQVEWKKASLVKEYCYNFNFITDEQNVTALHKKVQTLILHQHSAETVNQY